MFLFFIEIYVEYLHFFLGKNGSKSDDGDLPPLPPLHLGSLFGFPLYFRSVENNRLNVKLQKISFDS